MKFIILISLKSREISRKDTSIFAHVRHQHSLLGVNRSVWPLRSTDIKWPRWVQGWCQFFGL